ncbi:MAG: hypothetical protein GX329_00455 [Tissierellia bacterium]|nr:hypothetical protein [Tissierellia bacterium]
MIELSQINDDEYNDVELILAREGIEDELYDGIVYTLKDDETIIGAGKALLEPSYAVLEYIVIERGSRGMDLGDAILRSLLLKLNNLGIYDIFYPHCDAYLIQKGFRDNHIEDMARYELHLNIPSFFYGNCCGDCDGV